MNLLRFAIEEAAMELITNSFSNIVEIHTDRGDYGIPIIFTAAVKDGFNVGDDIVFVVEGDLIEKTWTIDSSEYEFAFSFTQEDVEKLIDGQYRYSFKRYRNGQYLETLQNGYIVIRETVQWQD